MRKNNPGGQTQFLPIFMCLGMSVGTAIGTATDNLSIGMCVGMSIGMCIGAMIDAKNRKSKNDVSAENEDIQEEESKDT